jgi:cell division protein FtsI/penicillin-binding protein 2
VINGTQGTTGTYGRVYQYPDLAPVTGYNHPIYGQAGLEAVLDEYLRGLRGSPAATIWWNHLLYGMSPDGLDVRLSLNLLLQARADELMKDRRGAVVLLNAQSGEVFAMASHPTFNPADLNDLGMQLNKDPDKPLINRAAQGLYPIGTLIEPFAQALSTATDLQTVYEMFAFTRAPILRMPVAEPVFIAGDEIHISPLQAALAAASLSNHGTIPAPRIATAVNTPSDGWVVLPALGGPVEAIPASVADEMAMSLFVEGQSYWAYLGQAESHESPVTWYVAGTPPNWQASPLVVAVLLEEDNGKLAAEIGNQLLSAAMNP